jgi:hypothetical protein
MVSGNDAQSLASSLMVLAQLLWQDGGHFKAYMWTATQTGTAHFLDVFLGRPELLVKPAMSGPGKNDNDVLCDISSLLRVGFP